MVLAGLVDGDTILTVRIAGVDAALSGSDMAAGSGIMDVSTSLSSTNTPFLSQTASTIVRTRTMKASVTPIARGAGSMAIWWFEGMRPSGGASHAVGSEMANEDAIGEDTDSVGCDKVTKKPRNEEEEGEEAKGGVYI